EPSPCCHAQKRCVLRRVDVPIAKNIAILSSTIRGLDIRHKAVNFHGLTIWTGSYPKGGSESHMHILWLILIGFLAGIVAKWLHPGPNEPSGFILTTILGIIGAFVATYLGQAIGWYRADQGAGFIGAIVGAVIILAIWSLFDRRR